MGGRRILPYAVSVPAVAAMMAPTTAVPMGEAVAAATPADEVPARHAAVAVMPGSMAMATVTIQRAGRGMGSMHHQRDDRRGGQGEQGIAHGQSRWEAHLPSARR